VEANLIPYVRRIVDRFVATRSIEKVKTVGRPPVNDEIVENLRQRLEENSKKSYHFRLSNCQKIVRKKKPDGIL
jgi:hypothetical protein